MGLVDYIDNELKFDDTFIGAMWVLARTNVIVEILIDEQEKSLFYFSDDSVVECSRIRDEEYSLKLHGTPDWTWNSIILPRMLINQENLPTRLSDSLLVTPQDYMVYRENRGIHNSESLIKFNELKSAPLIVKQLDRSFQRLLHTKRLMMFYHMNHQWNVEGLHVLASPSYN
ncbi:hypothetical protein [Peribacillus simplex]|uniref:hypothetical protein n=1 Tax=Peribacillus simplex TaxID=1478 RepID=UPI003D278924